MSTLLTDFWWPRHPAGGSEIYRDSQGKKYFAKFDNGQECERAIICHNAFAGIADPGAALEEARKALRDCIARFEGEAKKYVKAAHVIEQAKDALALLSPDNRKD